jgi:NigD-like C-terminal beta sandwich domain
MISHKPIEILDIILSTNKNKSVMDFKNEDFYLEDVSITDNILKLNVSYSGGCKKHQFLLVEKKNLQRAKDLYDVQLQLLHNSNNDTCKKIVTEDLFFNILPLKTKIQKENKDQKDINLLLIINNITINYN